MGTRAEITGKYATAYTKASKGDKGRMLDEVCAVTGWSRVGARRPLTQAARRRPGDVGDVRRVSARGRKYSYDALKILQRVWAASAASTWRRPSPCCSTCSSPMGSPGDEPRYTPAVRAEPGGDERGDHRPVPGPGARQGPRPGDQRNQGRAAAAGLDHHPHRTGDEAEAAPGFFEVDTVAHCGPVLKREFARTMNMTDVLTGRVLRPHDA